MLGLTRTLPALARPRQQSPVTRSDISIIVCIRGKFSRRKKLSPWPKACASRSRSMPRRSCACNGPSLVSRRRSASSGSSKR